MKNRDGVRWIDYSDDAREFVKENTSLVVEAAAVLVRDSIVLEMETYGPRSGEEYRIPGTRSKYRASAEGEPPAIREGLYRDSWKYSPATKAPDGRVVAFAYSDLVVNGYVLGELLEYGTIHMGPRPHVRNGIERAAREMETVLR